MCVSYRKAQIARVTNGILLTEAHTQKHEERKHLKYNVSGCYTVMAPMLYHNEQSRASTVVDPLQNFLCALTPSLEPCEQLVYLRYPEKKS